MLITNNLKAANTYKIGGELRHNQFSFRGGYKFEESPYQNTAFYGDLTGYSLGLGYNFGGTTLDLAYENSERTLNHQLYNVGLTDTTKLNTDNSLVTLTLGIIL
jgi:long-subunit fatty acid transport protein